MTRRTRRRRTRQEEAEDEEEEEQEEEEQEEQEEGEATDIKSNNPHLAGGEQLTVFTIGYQDTSKWTTCFHFLDSDFQFQLPFSNQPWCGQNNFN